MLDNRDSVLVTGPVIARTRQRSVYAFTGRFNNLPSSSFLPQHAVDFAARVQTNMHPTLKSAVDQLIQKHNLSSEQMQECVGAIMDGACDQVGIAAFLTAMACKKPAAIELVGAAQAMRDRAARIATIRRPLLDTCGTGGDKLHTFNISTATALSLIHI